MEISFSEKPRFKAPVKVMRPNDAGGFTTEKFTAHFYVIDHEEQKGLRDGAVDPDKEVLRAALCGWDGITEAETKQELGYTDARRDALLNVPYVAIALAQAYFPSLSNGTTRRKN